MLRVFVHPLLFLFAGGAYLLGVYKEFLLLLLALVLHETFHAAAASAMGYRILSVEFLPYGGRVSLESKGYGRIASEVVVLLAGPASHALFLGLPRPWTEALLGPYASWWWEVHASLLAFNLLPAFPLDGGRIVLAALAAWLPYRRAIYAAYGVGTGLVLAGAAFALHGFRTPSLGLALYTPLLLWWNVRGLCRAEEEFLRFLWRRYRFLPEVRTFPPLPLVFPSPDVSPLAVLRHARRERYLRASFPPLGTSLPGVRCGKIANAKDVAAGMRSPPSEEEGVFLARLFDRENRG
ncbi:MAG: Stage IV sporulation pro-sigma-K processing enzyme (SpoIVFB) [Brockia lithotrophica]|uniref:Stage IV sporulation pro-sigma-K processing enzyme (SpoIVFB) n=1 Tax=Brockia lithotrophica TaxID=933949 RepID=A0A2T5G7D5_9BACL|nr:MAG: Stage IV sporulation pro-sigma-K processing enzyme (SpoIVFB) [Brockia lithotrophica]